MQLEHSPEESTESLRHPALARGPLCGTVSATPATEGLHSLSRPGCPRAWQEKKRPAGAGPPEVIVPVPLPVE